MKLYDDSIHANRKRDRSGGLFYCVHRLRHSIGRRKPFRRSYSADSCVTVISSQVNVRYLRSPSSNIKCTSNLPSSKYSSWHSTSQLDSMSPSSFYSISSSVAMSRFISATALSPPEDWYSTLPSDPVVSSPRVSSRYFSRMAVPSRPSNS